ncbi:MAG: FapA family protein [Acidimicrobiales bacterium]
MHWEQRGEEVWLTVEPEDVTAMEEVIREADAAGYEQLDVGAVEVVLQRREPGAVARFDARRRAGALAVVVDPTGMTATLQVSAAGELAAPLTPAAVEVTLAEAGVKLGVDHLLLGALPLHVPGEYLVATGWEPAPGRDGQVEYTVTVSQEFRPQARRDGGVDFHSVATIPDVQNGQLLAVLVAPTAGTPGRTVRGEAVPAEPGADATLPTGENVTVSEDGRRLYAAIDGLLEVTAEKVSVRPDFVVPGDVDFETGSISFSGDVVVRGSVQPGFRVHAGGRVVVMGDVEDGEVQSESLVWVRGAVVGEHSVVRSAGDVKVRTVHHGRLEARRSVYVEREAHEATILAGVDLVFEGARNRISGGAAWAGHQVVAGEIGAVGGVATRVNVGIDPFTAELLEALVAEQAEHERTADRVQLAVAPFRQRPEALAALPADRRSAVERLLTIASSLEAQLAGIKDRIVALQPGEDDSRPRVVARQALRPGVVIAVRAARYIVRSTQHRVAATAIDGRVTLVPVGSEPVPVAPAMSI